MVPAGRKKQRPRQACAREIFAFASALESLGVQRANSERRVGGQCRLPQPRFMLARLVHINGRPDAAERLETTWHFISNRMNR